MTEQHRSPDKRVSQKAADDQAMIKRILDRIDATQVERLESRLPSPADLLGRLSLSPRKPLGQILVENHKITQEQLIDALKEQTTRKEGRLGQILLENEYVGPNDLLMVLAVQFDLPFFDELPVGDIDPDMVKGLSRSFCLQNLIVPVSRDNFGVTVAVADPLDLAAVDDLRLLLGTPVYRIVCPKSVIDGAINNVFERKDMSDEVASATLDDSDAEGIEGLDDVHDLLDDSEEAPIRREVSLIIRRAIGERASDIHIESFEDRLIVRYRVDGRLREVKVIPKKHQSSITTRIKILGKLDIAESRIPQDGRIPLKVGGRDLDIRLSTLPTKWGERIVMRILDKSQGITELDKLGLGEEIYRGFERLLRQKHGILLVTGPTGSGKTTTLASAIMYINQPDKNIITIEDPVEIVLPGVGQVEVHDKAGLTFATSLRSILRQDPDVILVQEIRDNETANIAVQAAITGHLMLSTLHTNDTATAVTRLTDLGVENYQIASSVLGVLATRLMRTLCTVCRDRFQYSVEELALLGLKPEDVVGKKLFRARQGGCPSCKNSGYSGRTGIYELLVVDDFVRAQILKSPDGATLKKMLVGRGMKTLRDSAIDKFTQGLTSLEETLQATQMEDEE